MRILQLSKFYPPVNGGIESVVFDLTEGLNSHGEITNVLCANESRHTIREEGRYKVTRAASMGKLLSTSIAPRLVYELARQHSSYDILHVHLPDPMMNFALWATRPKAKIVVHWHSDVVHQRLALKLYAPLQQWLLQRADGIVATSARYAESSVWLREFMSKVHVIPLGARDVAVAPSAESVMEICRRFGHKRIVLALGRMVYYKGFEHLIRASRYLPSDVHVVIGGHGDLFDELNRLVRAEGLSDRVTLTGRIPQAELPALYAAAEIFCLPSIVRAEAFGVVLLEAMAASLPVVATEIEGSGVPWVNQHGVTGLNVPPAVPEALAEALNTLLSQPRGAAALGGAGRRRFLECFTADLMVERTLCLYRQLSAFVEDSSHRPATRS